MTNIPTFSTGFNQKISVRLPADAEGLAVTMRIWNTIKGKVRQIRDPSNFYFTLGTGLVGVGLSAGVSAAQLWYCGITGQVNYAGVFWTAAAIVFLLCGLAFLHVGKCQRKVTSQRAEDVIDYMESWEESWLGDKANVAISKAPDASELSLKDIVGKWHLTFNPKTQQGKVVDLAPDGSLGEGRNKNEFRWKLEHGLFEFINSAGEVFSRFKYDPKDGALKSTDDQDTIAIKGQYMFRIRV